MADVRLPLRRYQSFSLPPYQLYLEQIVALFRIIGPENPPLIREAVVDTGAPMAVFPQNEWQQFEQFIAWLTTLHDSAVPKWCRQFGGVTGGTVPCRLGAISIELFDHLHGRSGPVELVAMFAHDGGQMRDILLGLSGGIFIKRRLEMVYDTQTVSLNDI